MDPVSITVSIINLIDTSYRLCDFISDVKDGGKERMKLLKEVSNLCCALDTPMERFNAPQADTSLLSRTLGKDDGPIQQCEAIINSLTKTLTSSKHVAGRVLQQLKWTFDKREVLQAVDQLHRIQATITQAVQQAMFTVVEKIQQEGSATLGIVEEKYSKDIRNWLSPLNFLVQQKAIYDSHCNGTGSKFLQSDEFNDFKRSTDSIMWCRGPPGAGKTYLSSIIAHHLHKEKESKGMRDVVLVIYCRYDDPACQVITHILGDLLKQCLACQEPPGQLPESLLKLHKVHTLSDTTPTCEELVTILAELLGKYQRCRIVVDALDEFRESNDRTSLLKALGLLRQSLRGGVPGIDTGAAELTSATEQCFLSLLIMSRDIQGIGLALRTTWAGDDPGQSRSTNYRYISYELSPNEDDVRLYLDWRIENDSSLKTLTAKRVGLKNEVLDAILRGSGSMFLLTRLMVDNIASCLTVKELKTSLQKTHTGLKVAYDATLERIRCLGEGRARRAFEVMKWVMFAQRPLTGAEIEHAVIVEAGSRDIDVDDLVSAANLASLRAGLVVIDQYRSFRFTHQTVSEYLKANCADEFDGQAQSIADCCLTYLMYDEFSKGPSNHVTEFRHRLVRYPLYAYCSRYWYRHMHGGPSPDQKRIVLRFFGSEPHWRSSRQAARSGQINDEIMLPHERLWGDSMFHHAAYLNAHHMFEDLYVTDKSVLNRRNELGRTPLMRSAVAHSLEFAKKLIDAGADINILDIDGDAALHIAVWKRDLPMVELLLSNPSVELEHRVTTISSDGTALCRAAEYNDIEIMQRLIQRGADIGALSATQHPAVRVAQDAINGIQDMSSEHITRHRDIDDLLSCFRETPYGDYAACEERLNEHQDILNADPRAETLLLEAVRLFQAYMELQQDDETHRVPKLVQLSFIVRECAELPPVDRATFFKSLKLGHMDELARVYVDFHIIMYHFRSAVQPGGALPTVSLPVNPGLSFQQSSGGRTRAFSIGRVQSVEFDDYLSDHDPREFDTRSLEEGFDSADASYISWRLPDEADT